MKNISILPIYDLSRYVLNGLTKFPKEITRLSGISSAKFKDSNTQQYFNALLDCIESSFDFKASSLETNILHVTRLAGIDQNFAKSLIGYPCANSEQLTDYYRKFIDRYRQEQLFLQIDEIKKTCAKSQTGLASATISIGELVDKLYKDLSTAEDVDSECSQRDLILKGLQRRKENLLDGTLRALPLGFPTLDKNLAGGVRSSDLVLIAADGGVGKTTWCNQVARNFARYSDSYVVIIQAELSEEQSAELFAYQYINRDIRDDDVDINEFENGIHRITSDSDNVLDKIIIEHTDTLNKTFLYNKLYSLSRRKPVCACIVDHPGLWMEDSWTADGAMEWKTRFAVISMLKNITKRLKIPILAPFHTTSEMSRLKPGEIPNLGHIGLAQARRLADIIMIMMREENGDTSVYNPKGRIGGSRGKEDKVTLIYDPSKREFRERNVTRSSQYMHTYSEDDQPYNDEGEL